MFFSLLYFTTTKTKIVAGEMIERERKKFHVYCVRESPTGTTRSVYSHAEEVSWPVPILPSGWIMGLGRGTDGLH